MADRAPTTLDLKLRYLLERELYARLVGSMGLDPVHSKWVISLWLWLESIGHHGFIRRVAAFGDEDVLGFVAEGASCLYRCLSYSNGIESGAGDDDELPLTSSLMAVPIRLSFFDRNYEAAMKGAERLIQNVGALIFEGAEKEVAARPSGLRQYSLFGEGTSERYMLFGEGLGTIFGASARQQLPPPEALKSSLNPEAKPWSPETEFKPEILRTLFITFSRGFPLSREDVTDFFNKRYGNCVETVLIGKAKDGLPPIYGRVILKSVLKIPLILNGQQTVKFVVKGKNMWARMYMPMKPE